MRASSISRFGFILSFFLASAAQADVHSYRYAVWLHSGEWAYTHELSGDEGKTGWRADVTRDKQGRVTEVVFYKDGKLMSKYLFHFDPGAKWPKGADYYDDAGALNSKYKYTRDSDGNRIKVETYTAAGQLTGYSSLTYMTDHVNETSYNTDGKPVRNYDDYYTPQGYLDRIVTYSSANKTLDTSIDPDTGNSQVMKIIIDGKLDHTKHSSYDDTGVLVREDLYDDQDHWYGVMEYTEGLKTRESYKFSDGGTQEILTTYDGRLAKEAKMSINDQFVCSFRFERFDNGVIKRTMAYGPNDELYAEYPDNYVDNVDIHGTPLMDVPKMVIHKEGDWW